MSPRNQRNFVGSLQAGQFLLLNRATKQYRNRQDIKHSGSVGVRDAKLSEIVAEMSTEEINAVLALADGKGEGD